VLPYALPYAEWRTTWLHTARPLGTVVQTRRSLLRWLWEIRKALTAELESLADKDFYGICRILQSHRSGCATNRKAITCRKDGGARRSTTSKKARSSRTS
jgi:hypothetical protein